MTALSPLEGAGWVEGTAFPPGKEQGSLRRRALRDSPRNEGLPRTTRDGGGQHHLLRLNGDNRAICTDRAGLGQALARAVIELEGLLVEGGPQSPSGRPPPTRDRGKRSGRLIRKVGGRATVQPGRPGIPPGGEPIHLKRKAIPTH